MKKTLLAAILLLSCEQAAHQTSDAEQVAREVFDAFNNHDWTRMESLYSDSVEMNDPSWPGVRKGKAGLTSFYQSVPDIHDEVKAMYTSGNTVTVEFVSTGTIEGQTFEMPICAVLTIADGKVIRDHTYYDQVP